MASNTFAPAIAIEREENRSWLDVPSVGTSSDSMVGWREHQPFITGSPSGLSATCSDDFFDDLAYLDNSSGLPTPISPNAVTFAPFFPSLNYELQSERTSMSAALPLYDPYPHPRGRRSLPFPPEVSTVRSRSTPRSLLPVFPVQPRRVVSTESLKLCHLPDVHHTPVADTGGFLSPLLPFLSSDSEYDPFVSSHWHTFYGNHLDHDQQVQVTADHTHASSPIRLSPSDDGDCNTRATSIGSSLSLLGKEDSAGNQSASQRENNFLTGDACGLRRSTTYPVGQSSLGAISQKPLGVSTCPADSIIDPSSVSGGSGVEVDEPSLLATGDRAASTLDGNLNAMQSSTPSGRARKFRPRVGSQAMVEACMRRRKKRMDSLNRLFVCEIAGCGRDFTARHNLRYHMKSHNDIRDEICYACGTGFVTRETLHRHQKRCKKSNRHYT